MNIDLNLIDKYNKKFDFAYCRFLFHAINEDVEDILFKWIAKNISSCIFIETRIYDEKTSHINILEDILPNKILRKDKRLVLQSNILSHQELFQDIKIFITLRISKLTHYCCESLSLKK